MKKYDEALAGLRPGAGEGLRAAEDRDPANARRHLRRPGEPGAARETLQETVRYAESLPAGQRLSKTIAALKKKLESMN